MRRRLQSRLTPRPFPALGELGAGAPVPGSGEGPSPAPSPGADSRVRPPGPDAKLPARRPSSGNCFSEARDSPAPRAPPQTVQPCVITRQQGLFPCTWPVFQTTLHSAGQKRPFTAGPGSECDPGKLSGDGDVSARRRLPSWACTSRTAGPRWPHAEGGRDGQHRK